MPVLETLVFILLTLPVALFVASVSLLSSIGKWLGFRRRYVKFLLYIFEYGRKKIEKANRLKYRIEEDDDVDDGISTASESDYQELSQDESDNAIAVSTTKEQRKLARRVRYISGNPEDFQDAESQPNSNFTSADEDEKDERDTAFELSDIFQFVCSGVEAIVQDQVTQRFASEELKSWNLLTRTNRQYEFISWRLSFVWVLGFFVRYCILLPLRVTICFMGVVCLTMSTGLVGCIPDTYHSVKQKLYKIVTLKSFEVLSWSLSAVIRHHHLENRPGVATRSKDGQAVIKGGGICVANHTSPIDVLVLAVDQCYDLVGQRHGGFLGILQRALARASSHIWFERGEMKDREAVARRLKEHVDDATKLPILIFPEGTCINNSAVMQFKKGSFEVGGVIYPVAIKYDARFGDPFWDSSNYSMVQYLLMMMSSWAIVCDVWYLPPMYRRARSSGEETETAVDFANRVKAEIARKGGLVDLDWDGQLKRAPAKKEWKEQQQLEYSRKFVSLSPRKQVNMNTNRERGKGGGDAIGTDGKSSTSNSRPESPTPTNTNTNLNVNLMSES